jgi:hypothetical protein
MPNGIPVSIRECKRFRRGRVQYLGGGSNSGSGSNQICCLRTIGCLLNKGGDVGEDGGSEAIYYNG